MSDEKRELLIQALVHAINGVDLDGYTRRQRAEILTDRVIAEGWQWHPPKEVKDEWRRIPGFPLYELNRQGQVRLTVRPYTEPEKIQYVSGKLGYVLFTEDDEIGDLQIRSLKHLWLSTFPNEEMETTEEWKQIPNFSNYEINKQGTVRTRSGYSFIDSNGPWFVLYDDDGKAFEITKSTLMRQVWGDR